MLALSSIFSAPTAPPTEPRASGTGALASPGVSLRFDDVYEAHFEFVWRSARRLGVGDGAVDDAVQEVFVVVHRRLADFEGRSSVKTWLFGILLRVVRHHRRTLKRKSPHSLSPGGADDPATLSDSPERGPHETAAKSEAVRTLHKILDELDDEKREVFVLAELEQLTAPEIAEALSVPLNTVYSRLRSARIEFDEAVARHRARDGWRTR